MVSPAAGIAAGSNNAVARGRTYLKFSEVFVQTATIVAKRACLMAFLSSLTRCARLDGVLPPGLFGLCLSLGKTGDHGD